MVIGGGDIIIGLIGRARNAEHIIVRIPGLKHLFEMIIILQIRAVRMAVGIQSVEDAIPRGSAVLVRKPVEITVLIERYRVPILIDKIAASICLPGVELSLLHVPAIDIGVGGIACGEIDNGRAAMALFCKDLNDPVGALRSVDRSRSGALYYFDALDIAEVKGVDIGRVYLQAIDHYHGLR